MTGSSISTSSPNITAHELRRILSYDPDTGNFVWKVRLSPARGPGERAGSLDGTGYRFIMIRRKRYLEHRLAWLHVTGEWPAKEIDHANAEKTDNRFANLREATRSQNQSNTGVHPRNTSGLRGAFWHSAKGKWTSGIRVNGKLKNLGYFRTAEDAHAAYERASIALHGEFRRGPTHADIFA